MSCFCFAAAFSNWRLDFDHRSSRGTVEDIRNARHCDQHIERPAHRDSKCCAVYQSRHGGPGLRQEGRCACSRDLTRGQPQSLSESSAQSLKAAQRLPSVLGMFTRLRDEITCRCYNSAIDRLWLELNEGELRKVLQAEGFSHTFVWEDGPAGVLSGPHAFRPHRAHHSRRRNDALNEWRIQNIPCGRALRCTRWRRALRTNGTARLPLHHWRKVKRRE